MESRNGVLKDLKSLPSRKDGVRARFAGGFGPCSTTCFLGLVFLHLLMYYSATGGKEMRHHVTCQYGDDGLSLDHSLE